MNCLNTLLKYPGSAQCPFERGILSQAQAADRSLLPEDSTRHTAPFNQIQKDPHLPVHSKKLLKTALGVFGGCIFIFPLSKMHVKFLVITFIITTRTSYYVLLSSANHTLCQKKGKH